MRQITKHRSGGGSMSQAQPRQPVWNEVLNRDRNKLKEGVTAQTRSGPEARHPQSHSFGSTLRGACPAEEEWGWGQPRAGAPVEGRTGCDF